MKGNIYLGGGGDERQSDQLDKQLAIQLEAVKEKPGCLYVPVALRPDSHAAAHSWFAESYGGIFETIRTVSDLSETNGLSEPYDVVYIGGGNTGYLLDQIYASGFDTYLRRHLLQGGIIYGGSAGAIVLGSTILTTSHTEHSAVSNKGLDMLGGYSVVAHYNDNDQDGILQLSQELSTPILAIPEDAGVIVEQNAELVVIGEGVLKVEPTGTVTQL